MPISAFAAEGAAMAVREARPSVPEGERPWPWLLVAVWASLGVLPAASPGAEVYVDL